MDSTSSAIGPKRYTYEELAKATGNFSRKNLIGQGGYGEVYKGLLDEHRAIKKLRILSNEQRKKEMEHEINVINSVSHRNLVKLVGYCIDGDDVLLVLEYFPNKCLRHSLHDSEKTLDWDKRMQIAKGVAKGLEYLHEYCNSKIIHQDIKPGNILLDNNFQPKIADFGLALTLQINATHVSCSTEGTEIYREKSNKTDEKSDVYSFGVVLLELITGRQPIWEDNNIVHWARSPIIPALKGQYTAFLDSNLQSYDKEEVKRLIYCAAKCVYKPSIDRPKIKEIVQVLEGLVSLREKDADDNNFLYGDPSVDLLRPTVQKLSIIPETDDHDDGDTVGFEVYNPRIFTYQQLIEATQSFSQFLGKGGLGPVYQGSIDGKEVAVRKLKNLPHEKRKEVMEKDIKNICSVNHPNLVRMVGYCIEGPNRCLVLEFLPSNTLKSHLHGNEKLDWSKRVKIAIDCAKGLEYLHENCKVIHGDIMTNNILVDNNFQAKVANFGLIMYYRAKRIDAYADPEDHKGIYKKSDIYAFGIVLLELITGKTTNNIVNGAKTLIQEALNGEYRAILDSKLQGNYNKEELKRMIYCATACLHKLSKFRPNMKKIVGVLEGSIPPKDLLDENDNQSSQSTMLKEMGEGGQMIACHTVEAWKQQFAKAKKMKRLVVVDFSASWCPPSRFMTPILAELANKMPSVTFLMVDVDKLKSVANYWAVDAMPTFLFFKQGQLVDEVLGANVNQLLSTIARHADGLPPPVLNPQTINGMMPGALPVPQMFLNQAMPTYNGTIPIDIPGTSIDPSQLQRPPTFTYGTTPYNYAPF